ncbi:MAG: tRNA (cytidine(34)-2'-O)-methyltransferase [Bdellovibrionales bacterium]|nr:tRNA (cytidine(34)-2'-O)-methyltransferase [Bdellovibrionales bacterium]
MSVRFHIVLHEPVIPQNTGSIARLCACTGASLHLIHPLGFAIDESKVKRAGLDYWPHLDVMEYENWEHFLEARKPEQLFLFTKFSKRSFYSVSIPPGAYLVFGSETKGLPLSLRENYPEACVQIPMRTELVRSLNLAQCAAVSVYEAIRQNAITF